MQCEIMTSLRRGALVVLMKALVSVLMCASYRMCDGSCLYTLPASSIPRNTRYGTLTSAVFELKQLCLHSPLWTSSDRKDLLFYHLSLHVLFIPRMHEQVDVLSAIVR